MFNRHLEVRLVKNTKSDPTTPVEEKPQIDIRAFAKEIGKQILVGSVVVVATSVVLNTIGIIVINAVDTATNKE